MVIGIIATNNQYKHLCANAPQVVFKWVNKLNELLDTNSFDAIFNFDENAANEDYTLFKKPVFIHSVNCTLIENKSPINVIRVNAWPSFIDKPIWEVAGIINTDAANILAQINKKYMLVNDVVGFVTARVIAMVINEAYFANEQNVSSKKDIDMAMKLGTNYPYGPFEWAEIIGFNNINSLLQKLAIVDKKYLPSLLMAKQILQ